MVLYHNVCCFDCFFSGCKGCLSRLYAVHEEIPDVDIIINAPALKRSVLLKHLDHELTNDTTFYEVYSSFNGLQLENNDRVVHFKRDPEEYYWVSINKKPCNIVAVLNKNIDSNWIFTMSGIDQAEVHRMGERFLQALILKFDSSATFKIGTED